MNVFLITYLVENQDQENRIVSNINQCGSWARIGSSSYCVSMNGASTVELRNRLRANVNGSYRIFVVDITKSSWASYGLPHVVTNWLKEQ